MELELTKQSLDLGILVADAERSLDFYRNVLGLPFDRTLNLPDGSAIHFLAVGGSRLKLYAAAKRPEARPPGGIHNEALGLRYFTLYIAGLQAVVDRCRAAGTPITGGPRQAVTGATVAFIQDPDGNNIELVQTPD